MFAKENGSAGWELVGVELLWIAANMIWMTEELALAEGIPQLRHLTAAILIVSAVITAPHTTLGSQIQSRLGNQDVAEKQSLISDATKETA